MATQAGPGSTLSQDQGLSGVPQGGCICRTPDGSRATYDTCTCPWGLMVRQALYLGYGATTLEASHSLPMLGGNFNILACRRRREILQDELDLWKGTTSAFCEAYQITRAQYGNFGLKRRS